MYLTTSQPLMSFDTLRAKIFYINSRTGQHSWDLPQETADEISDSGLAGLSAQSAVRAATGAGMVFGVAAPANGTNGSHLDMAGFGVPRSTDESEPWIRRVADDGQTYYFVNKLTGEVMQTRPEASAFDRSHPSLESIIPSTTQRHRAESRNSVYSDNSDVHPLDHPRPSHSLAPDRMQQQLTPTVQSNSMQRGVELTSEELITKQLQQMLTLPPPELVTDLASKACEAIQAIIDGVHGTINRFSGDQRMDDLIQAAVRCVRNLLYVSVTNTSHMPSDLLGKETRDKSSSPLKPAQRRVTATLSRLVLSARAMHYDSGSLISETLSRIEADALELERAVSSFIVEVQRVQNESRREGQLAKRLYGTFTTANIGVSLVGAGSAGSWKGFGWISPDSEAETPKIPLGQDAVAEVTIMLAKIESLCNPFIQVLVSSSVNSGECFGNYRSDYSSDVSSRPNPTTGSGNNYSHISFS
jgi:son of sevenless-like protein